MDNLHGSQMIPLTPLISNTAHMRRAIERATPVDPLQDAALSRYRQALAIATTVDEINAATEAYHAEIAPLSMETIFANEAALMGYTPERIQTLVRLSQVTGMFPVISGDEA